MLESVQSAVPLKAEVFFVDRVEDYFRGTFEAMACPCEVLIDCDDQPEAETLIGIARKEASRIESKFSRYKSDNIVYRINHSEGSPIQVDEETSLLLNYASTCYEVSDGLFDITSGALRRVWNFNGGDQVPVEADIQAVLQHVGWGRAKWENRTLQMPAGMEIDLGGIGKEYAVDRAAALIAARTQHSFLVNFGGDLYAGGLRRGKRSWAVGIDDPAGNGNRALYRLDISRAAIATSGDARRYVLWRGKRLGHILNPKSGWPVENAPRSVTVLSDTCVEAGTLSTLAYLQGPQARDFLEQQGVRFWII